VLSARQTAAGKDYGGEGMIGLTRAPMSAATPTVISTLQPATDESPEEPMICYYGNLKEGMDRAQALRQAQLSVRDDPDHPEWKDPSCWAPFVLWGDW
jgi:CHAT domain-containing protein